MSDELPWFETFKIGDVFESGRVLITEEAIIDYARQWDPQEFHIDPEAARNSQFGGLIASGMHVMGALFRAMIDAGFLKGTGMGAPGLDEVRWMKPVRPGDRIFMRATVTEIRPSATRDDRGYVRMKFEGINQRDDIVSSYYCTEIIKRRPKDGAQAGR